MNARELTGGLGVLAVVGFVALGVYTLLTEYAFEGAAGELAAPVVGSLVLAAIVVALLSALGVRGGGWIRTPYW